MLESDRRPKNPYGIQVHTCPNGCARIQFGYTMVHLNREAIRTLMSELCATQPEGTMQDLLLAMQVRQGSGTMA